MDIALIISEDVIQNSIVNGDFESDSGLETAILISLFSDQRVTEQELPPGTTDKKGWWGDVHPSVAGDRIGSKLWSLSREKVTTATAAKMETYTLAALEWLKEDGIATKVETTIEIIEINGTKMFSQDILIYRPGVGEPDRFSLTWDARELKRA